MFNRCLLFLTLAAVAIGATGCSHLLDREDRLRVYETDGKSIGINITTATRRLAIVHPSGRTCSELSPPAVLEVESSGKADVTAGETSVGKVGVGFEGEKKTTAVRLQETTERIECLRIALFHACELAAQRELTVEEEEDLLLETVENCGKWERLPTAEEPTTPDSGEHSGG